MKHIVLQHIRTTRLCLPKHASIAYLKCTSLLFVSTTGRGAVSSEAALAFFRGISRNEGVAS